MRNTTTTTAKAKLGQERPKGEIPLGDEYMVL